ncbi:MAG: ferredoxin [Rhodobacteraceae bacterium]|nr:ferredoxin [Paracoccaceae bacterium]
MDLSAYQSVDRAANSCFLQIYGGFHPQESDQAPAGTRTILMLGPFEPGFWEFTTKAAEFSDEKPNPLDRWSRRVIDALADEFAAQALYPFGGPPWLPFYSWAIRTGRSWASPVAFLVHDSAGLFVSYRGALAFTSHIELPSPPAHPPCTGCAAKPCLNSCPASVLDGTGYDSEGCIAYIGSGAGRDCLERGCAVRRACPVSANYPRSEAQSEFHQRALLRRHAPS